MLFYLDNDEKEIPPLPPVNSTLEVELRLINRDGVSNSAGRLEIRQPGGEWGTVCDDGFDGNQNAASVVCKQLGFA